MGQGQPRVTIYINFVKLESLMLNAKFQETGLCTYSRHRYQVRVNRTIGRLVHHSDMGIDEV